MNFFLKLLEPERFSNLQPQSLKNKYVCPREKRQEARDLFQKNIKVVCAKPPCISPDSLLKTMGVVGIWSQIPYSLINLYVIYSHPRKMTHLFRFFSNRLHTRQLESQRKENTQANFFSAPEPFSPSPNIIIRKKISNFKIQSESYPNRVTCKFHTSRGHLI